MLRPGSRKFTRGFLVVTPGVTIRDRLRVLQPNEPDSYYASRELVPNDMLRDLERAKIVVTNDRAFLRRETLPPSKGGRALLGASSLTGRPSHDGKHWPKPAAYAVPSRKDMVEWWTVTWPCWGKIRAPGWARWARWRPRAVDLMYGSLTIARRRAWDGTTRELAESSADVIRTGSRAGRPRYAGDVLHRTAQSCCTADSRWPGQVPIWMPVLSAVRPGPRPPMVRFRATAPATPKTSSLTVSET